MTGIAFCVRVRTDGLLHMLHPHNWSWLQLASEHRITVKRNHLIVCLTEIYRLYLKYKLYLCATVYQLACFSDQCIIAAHTFFVHFLLRVAGPFMWILFFKKDIFIIYSLPQKSFLALTKFKIQFYRNTQDVHYTLHSPTCRRKPQRKMVFN
jgi:hypothetical protein